MQTNQKLFPIGPNAADVRAGLFLTPDNFLTMPAKSCPVIIFWHGKGEAGDGTLATVASLYANGSPLAQARAGLLNSITCPVTGKIYQPAIFALQGTGGWCVPAADMAYAIRQLCKAYPQLDDSGMLATGLSAGGETTWEAIGGPDFALYAAGVPMSTPPINGPLVDWSRPIGKVLAIHGQNDSDITTYYNSVQLTAAVNAVHPGFANLILVPGEGHDAGLWTLGYTPSNRWPYVFAWDGKTPTSKNINSYEFWLACRNSNFLFPASAGTPITPPGAGALQAVAQVSVVGTTVTLDSTTSTGAVATCDWYVTNDKGVYVNNISAQSLSPGSRKLSVTFPAGNYIARLTLQASNGTTSVVRQPFTVGAVVASPAFPLTIPNGGFSFTLTADGTFTWK